MRSVMFKSTLREIKGSLGRWAAILAIVALGVGFFSGLKACRTAFLETGNKYLSEHGFFDYQLMSTLGLEDEDGHKEPADYEFKYEDSFQKFVHREKKK